MTATRTDAAPQQTEVSPRERFLAGLRGRGKYRYGRYGGLPLRYGGGKSLAVGHVVEQLPAGLTRLVSPFVGGASVEIACANELGMEVTAYDVFDILTNYWQVQLDTPEELADPHRSLAAGQGDLRLGEAAAEGTLGSLRTN